MGDFVVVINAEKVVVTGSKEEQKNTSATQDFLEVKKR